MIDLDSCQTKLEECLNSTFEGIAFSQIFECRKLDAPAEIKGKSYGAYIDLPEPIGARFFMLLTHEHVCELFESAAAGMDANEMPAEVLLDFVNELTNTAAGHVHTALAPEKTDMSIGLPVHADADAITRCTTPSADNMVLFLQVEEYEVHCSMSKPD